MSEIKRLKTLLPPELRSQVIIVRTTKVNSALISARKTGNDRFAVQIDLMRWQQMNLNQRDLLFWHEIAQIKNRTVNQSPNDLIILGLGLCALLVELVVPNLLLLAAICSLCCSLDAQCHDACKVVPGAVTN